VWQGGQDSNLQPAVLETAALPIEPPPLAVKPDMSPPKKTFLAQHSLADFTYPHSV